MNDKSCKIIRDGFGAYTILEFVPPWKLLWFSFGGYWRIPQWLESNGSAYWWGRRFPTEKSAEERIEEHEAFLSKSRIPAVETKRLRFINHTRYVHEGLK